MYQKNKSTGFERRIRMAIRENEIQDETEDKLQDTTNSYFYWEWLNDAKKYTSFSPYASVELEKKFQIYNNLKSVDIKSQAVKSSGSFDIKIYNSDNQSSNKIVESLVAYKIDFDKMEQTNKKSGFSRKIKREISGK